MKDSLKSLASPKEDSPQSSVKEVYTLTALTQKSCIHSQALYVQSVVGSYAKELYTLTSSVCTERCGESSVWLAKSFSELFSSAQELYAALLFHT